MVTDAATLRGFTRAQLAARRLPRPGIPFPGTAPVAAWRLHAPVLSADVPAFDAASAALLARSVVGVTGATPPCLLRRLAGAIDTIHFAPAAILNRATLVLGPPGAAYVLGGQGSARPPLCVMAQPGADALGAALWEDLMAFGNSVARALFPPHVLRDRVFDMAVINRA
jgi:hypothetical protein